MLHSMAVFAFPPRDDCKMRVSLESRKGTCELHMYNSHNDQSDTPHSKMRVLHNMHNTMVPLNNSEYCELQIPALKLHTCLKIDRVLKGQTGWKLALTLVCSAKGREHFFFKRSISKHGRRFEAIFVATEFGTCNSRYQSLTNCNLSQKL